MTKKNRKIWKRLAAILASLLILGLAVITSCLVGDPLSKALIKNTCKNYLKATYPQQNYVIYDDTFGFVFSYEFWVQDPDVTDSRFLIDYQQGKLVYDSHSTMVSNLKNTQKRLSECVTQDFNAILAKEPAFAGYSAYGIYGAPVNQEEDAPMIGLLNYSDVCYIDMPYDSQNIQVPLRIDLQCSTLSGDFSGKDAVALLKKCDEVMKKNGFDVDVFSLFVNNYNTSSFNTGIEGAFTFQTKNIQHAQLNDPKLPQQLDELQKEFRK